MYGTRLYREQHTRIRALLLPLTTPARAELPATELASALAKLAGAVKLHLRDEDARLYPALAQARDPEARTMAIVFQQQMGGLSEAFVAFYERWIRPGAIDADRPGFLQAADDVLGALGTRMDAEDQRLYPLVDAEANGT